MGDLNFSLLLGSVVAGATPIVLAVIGETISERAGVINLSLDGSILLSAMSAFAVSYETHSLWLGFGAGALAGAAVAAVIGIMSVYLRQSQVAVGFILTLTARDLAYFLGNPYSRLYGPQTPQVPLPGMAQIPFLGEVFFQQAVPVYLSLALILGAWYFVFRTPPGLVLRAVGENPAAAYARGSHPRRVQMLCTLLGGLLVGVAGATFALCTKPGWGRPQGAEGTGWIALAIVIFGGWHPVKAALGAYLFAFLQVMGIHLQGAWPSIPSQVFQVAPFPLMILALVLMYVAQGGRTEKRATKGGKLRRVVLRLGGAPPAALGKPFKAG